METNRSRYNKPKREESHGSWIEVRKGEKDNIDILSSIRESCLDEQVLRQNYQITSTSLYINTHLEQKFADKEQELEQLLHEKPPQMFAFGLVRTEAHATEVCERSAFHRQVLHAPLGDPMKGVNVGRHADVLMTWAFKKRCQRPWLIVYRIMKGRSKEVKPRFTSQAPQVNPTPNADSHICKETNMKVEFVHEQLNQSQIFLYELDNQGRPSKHPRHCLPYAIISYKQRAVPLQLPLSNSASQKKRVPICTSTSVNEDTSARNRRPSLSDHCESTSPSLSLDEGTALSRFLQTEAASLESLDSNQLDSKLAEIKREREEVMNKLKAIQNMREAITSASCSSESEQEIDKVLDKLGERSWRSDGLANKDKSYSLKSSEKKTGGLKDSIPDHQGGDQSGRRYSQESERHGRSASSSGWKDPYHWTPHQNSSTTHHLSLQMQNGGNNSGQNMDYYNNDEQSEMFDLDEMMYASQSKATTKQLDLKPSDKPGRFSDRPGVFKDDLLPLEPQGSHRTEIQGQIEYPLSSHCIKTEVANPVDSAQHIASLTENSLAGGDNQLSSDTRVQDMDIDESSQSSITHGSHGNPAIQVQEVVTPDNPLTLPSYNNSLFESISGAQEANVDSCLNYSTQAPFNSLPDVDLQEASMDIVCPDYGTPASGNTPNSNDFSSSQVVSRDADGRLRLSSQTNSPEVPITTVVFQRPPSPLHFTDAVMSPPPPPPPSVAPYFKFESNLLPIKPADTTISHSYTPVAQLPISDGPKLSEGTQSAVDALQQEMAQTNDPTQRCALQVAINTLLAKTMVKPTEKISQPKEEMKTRRISTGDQTQAMPPFHPPVQNEDHLPEGTSDNAGTVDPKAKTPKVFYGHPLIKRGKKPPRPILMEKLPDGPQPVDPRPARSSLFGRKFEASFTILSWGEMVPIIREQPKADVQSVKKNQPANCPQAKPNLRDPRICKKIVTDAMNPINAATNILKETGDEALVIDQNKNLCTKQSDEDWSLKPRVLEEEIIFLGARKSGNDTPESGEICDSPLKQDMRTVVYNNGQDQDGASQQLKILERLKYVQDIDASIPDSVTHRKVEVEQKQQENVFNRLGNKRKRTDDKEKFDLRQKIKGKKPASLTGYNMRDEFLHSESSNDSSVVELKRWSPTPAGNESFANSFKWYNKRPYDHTSASTGRYMETGKSAYENEMDAYLKERDRLKTQLARERSLSCDGYSNERDRSGNLYRREGNRDRHTQERDRRDIRRSPLYRGIDTKDDRYRDRYERESDYYRDQYFERNQPKDRLYTDRSHLGYSNERNLSRDGFPRRSSSRERSFKRSSSRERSLKRSSSRDRSSRRSSSRSRSSRRSSSRNRSSQRNSSRNRSSKRSLSRDRSSQRSLSRDRSTQRHFSRDRSSQRSLSKDRLSQRSESSTSCVSQGSISKEDQSSVPYSGLQYNPSRHEDTQDVRTPLSRSSSVSSSGNTYPNQKDHFGALSSKQSAIHESLAKEHLQESHQYKFESLEDRLEKEHGIAPAKKRKKSLSSSSEPNVTEGRQNESLNYKTLSTSLASLKQSVSEAVRSFRDISKYELQSRVDKYQERYQKLQDMAIRALECHYETDRIPSEMDRDVQQRLLEMITDIEVQREGLNKYKSSPSKQNSTSASCHTSSSPKSDSTRGSDSEVVHQKAVCSRTSPEIANQMYDRWQNKKCGTNSPARSTSGSSQKQRCP